MSNSDLYTAEIAADPTLPAGTMQEIAASRSDLLPALASNPSLYPELKEWILGQGVSPSDPGGPIAIGARSTVRTGGPMVPPTRNHTALWIVALILIACRPFTPLIHSIFGSYYVSGGVIAILGLFCAVFVGIAAIQSASPSRKATAGVVGLMIPLLISLFDAYVTFGEMVLGYPAVSYAFGEIAYLYGPWLVAICWSAAYGLARPLRGVAWIAVPILAIVPQGFMMWAYRSLGHFLITNLIYIGLLVGGVALAEGLNRTVRPRMAAVNDFGEPSYGYGPNGALAVPVNQYGQPLHSQSRRSTNTLAVLSLVFAFLFSIAGVILGHAALAQINRTGEEGRGLAIAGLVVGYVNIALSLVAIVLWTSFLAVLTY